MESERLGSRRRKLRDNRFNQKPKGERANWEWDEIGHFQSLSQVTDFPSKAALPKPSLTGATEWKPSVPIPEPMAVISHSNDDQAVHQLFKNLFYYLSIYLCTHTLLEVPWQVVLVGFCLTPRRSQC